MAVTPGPSGPKVSAPAPDAGLADRLERGEVVHYPTCPFLLPEGEDRGFLLEQRLGSRVHKNISYDPTRERLTGYRYRSRAQEERLADLLADFSRVATRWLAATLPRYASGWKLDRVSFRTEEEATRRLRTSARNDLLHIDAFPSRPTNGARILRLFTNINPTEPRVWVTSDSFARLLERFGKHVGLPQQGGQGWLRRLLAIVSGRSGLSSYDDFMLRFHHFLKVNDDFQERSFKRYWNFEPGSAWLLMSDAVSHAALRGCFALEHSYFVAPQTLALPELAPAALLERTCGTSVLHKAA